MKTRIQLLILMFLFAGSSVMAQKEARQVSLKMYLPIQFEARNYQMGAYTWGRWHTPGLELGLNLKKKRFEQEFILGSPRTYSDTYTHDGPGDTTSTYYFTTNLIQTLVSFNYQAGYGIFTSGSGKFCIVSGLGINLRTNFAKWVEYYNGPGKVAFKMQITTFRPYLFSTFRYALGAKWNVEGTVMYSPYDPMYVRSKSFYDGSNRVEHSWMVNDYGKSMIYSRVGVGYKF